MTLHYQDMPKAIQDLTDGAESLQYVKRIHKDGKVLYQFVFRDSFEIWASDAKGNRISETPFIPIEKA